MRSGLTDSAGTHGPSATPTRALRTSCFRGSIEIEATSRSQVDADGDADWNEQVTLVISGRILSLSHAQKKVIALDYGMRSGRAIIPVWKALLYYALKRLGLDMDHSARRPQDQQIVLINHEAVSGIPFSRRRGRAER